MKEEEGDLQEAARILQELQVETYGSMERKEKVIHQSTHVFAQGIPKTSEFLHEQYILNETLPISFMLLPI
jgi:hypothetical protein